MITDNGTKLIAFLNEKMHEGSFSNDDLVQFIESCGKYLNLQSIPEYAKTHGISYNGTKKFRTIINLFKIKFVIDNK